MKPPSKKIMKFTGFSAFMRHRYRNRKINEKWFKKNRKKH